MKKIIITSLFSLLIALTCAQSVYFEKKFGGSWTDYSQVIKEFDDGTLLIGGYSDSISQDGSFDPVLVKLDKFGNWLWTKHYTSAESDYAFYMTVLRDKTIFMVGETNEGGANGVEVLFLKLDTAGNEIWRKTWGGPGTQSIEYCDTTNDGNVILCGFGSSANGDLDELLVKADTAGNVIWYKLHGGTQTEYGDFVKQTQDGGYITSSVTNSYGAGSFDGWILKLDANGDTLWTRTSGNAYSGGCQGVCVTADGNYILYGEEELFTGSWFNFWMAKYDVNGNLKWKKNFGGTGSDALFNVMEANDKGFYCSGYSNSYNGQAPLDLIFLKTDSLGNMQWKKTYGGNGIDIAYDMIASNSGGLIITGQTEDPVLQTQYYVIHLDTLGSITGLGEQEKARVIFSVYPNPATENFTVHLNTAEEFTAQLFDARGQLVQTINGNGNEISFPSKKSSAGLYYIKVKTSKGEATQKLMLLSVEH